MEIASFTTIRASQARLSSVRAAVCALALVISACGIVKEKPKDQPSDFAFAGKEMSPEQANAVLGEVGSNFAYGPGLGDTAVSIGTAVIFPPYIIYLLGNTALSLSGYEPVTVSSMLPEEEGRAWSNGYDTLVSGPGRMVAAVAGHEYRSREVAQEKLRMALAPEKPDTARAQMKDGAP